MVLAMPMNAILDVQKIVVLLNVKIENVNQEKEKTALILQTIVSVSEDIVIQKLHNVIIKVAEMKFVTAGKIH